MSEFSSRQKRLKGKRFLPQAAPPPKEGGGNEAGQISCHCDARRYGKSLLFITILASFYKQFKLFINYYIIVLKKKSDRVGVEWRNN